MAEIDNRERDLATAKEEAREIQEKTTMILCGMDTRTFLYRP